MTNYLPFLFWMGQLLAMVFLGFPPSCKTFDGPFSENCLIEAYLAQGCSPVGNEYPVNINDRQNRSLQTGVLT